MKIEESDLAGSYTYADYLTWQWTEMVELIHGKIYEKDAACTRLAFVKNNSKSVAQNLDGVSNGLTIAEFKRLAIGQ
jgi:translation elongation factor EF-Ts